MNKRNRTIWKKIIIAVLLLQAALELVIGLSILFNFPATLESGFGISYIPELDILGIALGLYLLLLTALMVISSIWINKGNKSGITLAITIGVFLVTFGIVTLMKTGNVEAIMVDSLRGGLTIFLTYMAKKELIS